MKVVFVAPAYFPKIGGVERHLKEIADRLAESIQVEVFTIDHVQKQTVKEEIVDGVLVKTFRSRRIAYGIEIPSKDFVEALRASDGAIIHLHSLHSLLPRYVLGALTARSSRLIITPYYHGRGHTLIRNFLFKMYKGSLARVIHHADMVICVSESEKALLRKDFRLPDDKVVVIPSGVDFSLSNINTRSRKPGKLLFVGRLEKYKNADKVVKALGLLAGKGNFTLTIVGDGPQRNHLKKLCAKMNLEDIATFRNNLSNEELAAEYSSSEILVMPSYFESFGRVVAEALSSGMKVIVADTSALSEFVKNKYAYGIPLPVTAEKLAGAILNIATTKNKAEKYPMQTWESVIENLKRAYAEVVSSQVAERGSS